jgi:hypothetical protein
LRLNVKGKTGANRRKRAQTGANGRQRARTGAFGRVSAPFGAAQPARKVQQRRDLVSATFVDLPTAGRKFCAAAGLKIVSLLPKSGYAK